MQSILFINAMIFDGTGREPFAGEILVTGNRIAVVAEGKEQISHDGAAIIHLRWSCQAEISF